MSGPTSLLLRAFAARAAAAPQACAVAQAGATLTYGELDRRSNRLAWELRRLGVGSESRVAVMAERSPRAIVAILGVLKAGGAYVPFDPRGGSQRAATMAADAEVVAAVAGEAAAEAAASVAGGAVVTVDDAPGGPAEPPEVRHDGRGAAYVIFTSGSTGVPSGVVVEHRSLDNFLRWSHRFFGIAAGDRVLQFAPLVFDGHIWEVFGPLTAGARIQLPASDEEVRDLDRLASLIAVERITHMDVVASVLALMTPGPLPHLRVCLTGSEAVPAEVVERWSAPGRRVVNGYGATELTNLSHVAVCEPDGAPPPLGSPIDGCRAYLLDDSLEPVAPGEVGQIHVGGILLARGYAGRPELTAARFVPDPFVPGERMYRTGDLARRDERGELRFVGRVDDQVQIAGHRVEPVEVETALRRCPGVRDAAVVPVTEVGDRVRLVAYVVGRDERLRSRLGDALPAYMLPHDIVVADSLPRLVSGKVDRRALARRRPPAASAARAGAAAGSALEQALVACVGEVLHRPVLPDDRFVALGGDSLDAMRVVSKLRARTGVRARVSTLLDDEPLRAAVAGLERDEVA